MLQIGQLLSRFKNISNSEKIKKQLIVEIMERNNIPIKINQLSFSKNTLFLKAQPIVKTEALFKKQTILTEIQKIPGLTTISNIQ
ncbi:MAG: hypothetical protein Q8909_20555 [Bacteroidota bacterium]|nr:hypothetical protein [Bacteroidota bacterium]